jgi:hypothetical protein
MADKNLNSINQSKKTFFIHVGKTAGSSFNKFLRSYFSGEEHCERYRVNGKSGQLQSLSHLKTLNYVSGHLKLTEFLKNFDREQYFLTTILRHPVDQTISHLNWIIFISENVDSAFFENHPKFIKDMSLNIRSQNLEDPRNIQSILKEYKGMFQNNQSRYFWTEKLDSDSVIRNLSKFDLVGLTEQYPKFLSDYTKLLGIEVDLKVHKENQNKKPKVDKKLLKQDQAFLKFLRNYSPIDFKVYDYFYQAQSPQPSG